MTQAPDKYLSIKEGDILTFDVLEWFHEGYEFGRPCLMLSPVLRENSDQHPDTLIESVMINAVCDGKIDQSPGYAEQEIEWRGWNLKQLRRRFNEALKGKKFPVAGYIATRQVVKVTKDEDGELSWEEVK